MKGMKLGEILAVYVIGNPLPIAVGSSAVSENEFNKGQKALKIWNNVHCYCDQIWVKCGSHKPEGFKEDSVVAINNENVLITQINFKPPGNIYISSIHYILTKHLNIFVANF